MSLSSMVLSDERSSMTLEELTEFRDKIISIMTTYKYDEDERIYYIMEVIQSYPETVRLYHAYMGNFS